MIFGVLIRFVLALGRRRGLKLPDPSRLRSRQPVFGVTSRLAESLAEQVDTRLAQRERR